MKYTTGNMSLTRINQKDYFLLLMHEKNQSNVDIIEPKKFPLDHINKIHQNHYLQFIKQKSEITPDKEIFYPSYFIMDTCTPITNGTYDAAVAAVNVALTGAELLKVNNRFVYSLCRPPGHHAEADPKYKFPYSSGFSDEKGSGPGLGFNRNYPMPLGTDDKRYLQVLQQALNDIKKYNPKYLVISTGFDTYDKDPIGGFKLTIPFYTTMGKEITKLNLPMLLIQEGGYHVGHLGTIALNFVQGILYKQVQNNSNY